MKTRKEIEAAIALNKANLKTFLDGIGEKSMTPDEVTQAEAFVAKNVELLGELAKCDESDARKKALRELGGTLPPAGVQPQNVGLGSGDPRKRVNLGKAFVEDEQFKTWLKRMAPNGSLPESHVEDSPQVGFKTLVTGGSPTSGGAFEETTYTGIYESLGRAPLSVYDLVAHDITTGPLVEFVRQTKQITETANVPESNVTNFQGGTGEISGLKPEAGLMFEIVTERVKTIAAWVPASRQSIADYGQLQGIINGELRDDEMANLEYQIVLGNGVGSNFLGILATPNILTMPWDTNIFRTTRKAKTSLRVNGRSTPTAWLMNPADWENLDLETDLQGRYYFGGPVQMGVKTLWGVPVVECEVVPQGQSILGDFRKAKLWDKEESTIRISDSHADFFIRNLIAILGEMRAAFGVIRPTAFIIVEMESGT